MVVLIFALASLINGNGKEFRVVEDLRPQWRIIGEGKFHKYQGQSTKTIHFSLDLSKNGTFFLQIQSKTNFYLFINSSLITSGQHLKINADSLKQLYGKNVFASIYQNQSIKDLSIQWVVYENKSQFYNPLLPGKSFQNFVLLSTLLLVILFTGLLRSNPQLTVDYLNVIKLFSLKHRDDSQFVLRITSSVNLLFYFFCSLLTSLAILIAIHNTTYLSSLMDIGSKTTGEHMIKWFLVSLLIFGLLMMKLLLASTFSMLFDWRDMAGFQFFNFVRVLVISLMLIGVISIFSFSMNINLNYFFLVKCFCALLSFGAGLMFFKLLNRESATPFHLFSYLCATEIFPLVILIKVFLF
jgi:hypothetical protein